MTTVDPPAVRFIKEAPATEAVEGAVVEHQGRGRVVERRPRPAWAMSSGALAEQARYAMENVCDWTGHHVIHAPYYVGWSVRGYRRLARRWLEAHRDYHPQLIRSGVENLRAADGDTVAEQRAQALLEDRRSAYSQHKRVHWIKTGVWTAAAASGGVAGALVGGFWVDLLLAVSTVAVGAYHGRPEPQSETDTSVPVPVAPATELVATAPSSAPAASTTAPATEPVDVPDVPSFDAPPPPALSEEALTAALRDIKLIKPEARVKVLAAPAWGKDGTATTVFDLPSGITVVMLQKKLEELAGALGRDATMVDITKAGAAGRASLWMADAHPFAAARPSPLLQHSGGIDAWKDGVPVAWAKRGSAVRLPIKDSNFLIGGMTRSGKGVGAANLTAGSTRDVRINLRIVAGKSNGEWDPYAKSGIAATYFKPNPQRLLTLLQAELADKTRREAELGKLGKSKLIPEAIMALGGIELIVIDELATYTRPGKPLREEILEALIEVSAVAAGGGILFVLLTQYPEVDVLPQALAVNCGTRWAMRVDNATQSNAILGSGASGAGRDASKFDPPIPGLGWLVNPFAGITDLARSFDLDEDLRGEITHVLARSAELRKAAGRLAGQWDDPIEQYLLNATGLSSAAGGPKRDGIPGRNVQSHTPEQRMQVEACRGALKVMRDLGRDVAQLREMADLIGGGMTETQLGELLRAAGAGGTVKITLPGREGQVRGYRRDDVQAAMDLLLGE